MLPQPFHLLQGKTPGLMQVFQAEEEAGDIQEAELDYTPMEGRTDAGALWENYFISERHKYLHYNKIYVTQIFLENSCSARD